VNKEAALFSENWYTTRLDGNNTRHITVWTLSAVKFRRAMPLNNSVYELVVWVCSRYRRKKREYLEDLGVDGGMLLKFE
jgi:hypothetical protein